MVSFSTGLKEYLEHTRVKKSYVSEMSGINETRLEQILNDEQQVTEEEMIAISSSLGLDPDYFMNRRFLDENDTDADEDELEHCLASLTEKQAKIIRALDSYLASASYILGAPRRLDQMAADLNEEFPWKKNG